MIIRDILHLKGNAIFSIASTGSMSEAVRIMARNDIGSLVIRETSFENRLLKRYIEHSPEESAR